MTTPQAQPSDQGKTLSSPIDATLQAALQACVDHAEDLLASARLVAESGRPNIAWHLATLTLEEIGRRELLVVRKLASSRPIPPAWPDKHLTNHVQKLFWAFFGADFLTAPLTPKHFEEIRELASTIHRARLAALYVDVDDDGLRIPSETIDPKDAQMLIGMAAARLDMAKTQTHRTDASEDDIDLTEWFMRVVEDPIWRKVIFSSASMTKLGELLDGRKWIVWVKEQYDAAAAVAMTAATNELARVVPAQRTQDKWSMVLRILTASHQIPPKVLSLWNKNIPHIKLSMPDAKKKHEMQVDLRLGDDVPLQGVYWWGDVNTRQFIVALNIATRGFWWYHIYKHPERYYESLTDLDSGASLNAEYQQYALPFSGDVVLHESHLQHTSMCMSVLGQLTQQQKTAAFDAYISGLNFLSLNDVMVRLDADAFYAFCASLRGMMQLAADDRTLQAALPELLAESYPTSSPQDRDAFVAVACLPEDRRGRDPRIKTVDIVAAKGLCDRYFLSRIGPMFPAVWGTATVRGEVGSADREATAREPAGPEV